MEIFIDLHRKLSDCDIPNDFLFISSYINIVRIYLNTMIVKYIQTINIS